MFLRTIGGAKVANEFRQQRSTCGAFGCLRGGRFGEAMNRNGWRSRSRGWLRRFGWLAGAAKGVKELHAVAARIRANGKFDGRRIAVVEPSGERGTWVKNRNLFAGSRMRVFEPAWIEFVFVSPVIQRNIVGRIDVDYGSFTPATRFVKRTFDFDFAHWNLPLS